MGRGFAFDADGGAAPHWSSLPPALLYMPRVALARVDGSCHLTLCAVLEPGADPEAEHADLAARLAACARRRCRCSTRAPARDAGAKRAPAERLRARG